MNASKSWANTPMNEPEKNIKNDEKSQLKTLIAKGKEQGFLTYAEVNDHLPNEIIEPEQIEDIVNMINHIIQIRSSSAQTRFQKSIFRIP